MYLRVDAVDEGGLINDLIIGVEKLVEDVLICLLADLCPLLQTVSLAVVFVVGSTVEGRQSQDSGLEMNVLTDTAKRMVFAHRKEVFYEDNQC